MWIMRMSMCLLDASTPFQKCPIVITYISETYTIHPPDRAAQILTQSVLHIAYLYTINRIVAPRIRMIWFVVWNSSRTVKTDTSNNLRQDGENAAQSERGCRESGGEARESQRFACCSDRSADSTSFATRTRVRQCAALELFVFDREQKEASCRAGAASESCASVVRASGTGHRRDAARDPRCIQVRNGYTDRAVGGMHLITNAAVVATLCVCILEVLGTTTRLWKSGSRAGMS